MGGGGQSRSGERGERQRGGASEEAVAAVACVVFFGVGRHRGLPAPICTDGSRSLVPAYPLPPVTRPLRVVAAVSRLPAAISRPSTSATSSPAPSPSLLHPRSASPALFPPLHPHMATGALLGEGGEDDGARWPRSVGDAMGERRDVWGGGPSGQGRRRVQCAYIGGCIRNATKVVRERGVRRRGGAALRDHPGHAGAAFGRDAQNEAGCGKARGGGGGGHAGAPAANFTCVTRLRCVAHGTVPAGAAALTVACSTKHCQAAAWQAAACFRVALIPG